MQSIVFKTRMGWMAAACTGKGVSRVILPVSKKVEAVRLLGGDCDAKSNSSLLLRLRDDLIRYFNGERVAFQKYPLDYGKATRFQKKVWSAARKIPYGAKITYGRLAAKACSPAACRAVGQAMNHNPMPVLVPCHRVVACDGLGGFACGTDLKAKMLIMEYKR